VNLSRFKLRLRRAALLVALTSIAPSCPVLLRAADRNSARKPVPAIASVLQDLASQLERARACVMSIQEPLEGKTDQTTQDAYNAVTSILNQITLAEGQLQLPQGATSFAHCAPKVNEDPKKKALDSVNNGLSDIGELRQRHWVPNSDHGPPTGDILAHSTSLLSEIANELTSFQIPSAPAVEGGKTGAQNKQSGPQPTMLTALLEQAPFPTLEQLAQRLNRAESCIEVLQIVEGESNPVKPNAAGILNEIDDVKKQLDLAKFNLTPPACNQGSSQAALQSAIDEVSKASIDFPNLPTNLTTQNSGLPSYTSDQYLEAVQSISRATDDLKRYVLPSSRTIGGGDLIEVFALFVSFAALAILMLTFLQSKNRSMRETTQEDEPAREMRELVDMANTALTAANLALKQATAARARLVKEVEQQQAAIAQMNSDYEQERTAPRAQPDPDPYADRNSSASRQWNEVSSNDAVVTFGGNPRPSLAPDSSTDLDPIAEFRFAEPLPDYTPQPPNDAKLLTGNPVEDYNRCLEMSLSEAEDRFYGRYRDVLRLSCTNLHEHRNPNAKLLFKLDAMGNFLATSADRGQIAVLPMIGLDPADNRRLLEGVFTYPAGSGKFRLHRPAVAGVETADTFVIRERDQRGEFERVS